MQFRGEQRGAVVTYFFRTIMHWSVGFPAADSHELKNILNVIFLVLKKKRLIFCQDTCLSKALCFGFRRRIH